MENKTALIAGATGLVGKELLKILIEDDYYTRIILISRNPVDLSDSRIDEKIVDFNNLGDCINEVFANDIYCCLGTTMKKAGSRGKFRLIDYQYPVDLARIMYKNGARQYLLVSAIGADSRSAEPCDTHDNRTGAKKKIHC